MSQKNTLNLGPKSPQRIGRLIHPSAAAKWEYPGEGQFSSFRGLHALLMRRESGEPLQERAQRSYHQVFGEQADMVLTAAYTSRANIDDVLMDAYLTFLIQVVNTDDRREEFLREFAAAKGCVRFYETLDDEEPLYTRPDDFYLTALHRFHARLLVAETIA